ncbi:hypothetical protein G6011_06945 [Alternaria panax]|uniref:Uncharacterized protein n=1 Tax=Alternaria panax TaxID=48097 RepID=A0AAD4FDP4_9PLEO|nr:hypothetical protein G6011_06945 [Alternaria panax]
MPSTFSYLPPSYHPALYYRPTAPTDYLPADEHRYLVKLQDRSRLETHFAQPSLPYKPHHRKTVYQHQPNLTRERRTQISEIAHATRKVLGEGFDFTDDGFEKLQKVTVTTTAVTVEDDSYARHKCTDTNEPTHTPSPSTPIPSRRIHALGQKYWDDDNKYMDEQYRRNGYSMRNHTGRHVNVDRTIHTSPGLLELVHPHPEPTPLLLLLPPPQLERKERHDSGIGESPVYGPTAELKSAFSWSSDDEDEKPKRRLWGRLRRSSKDTG